VPEALALDSGELTPTQKVVRSVVMQRYASLLAALRGEKPHPQVADLSRRGRDFEQT
jgi:hypothetical protein